MLSNERSTGEVPSQSRKEFPTNWLWFIDMVALPLFFCIMALPLFFFVWIGFRVGGHNGWVPFLFSTITRWIVLPLGLAMVLAAPLTFLKGWRGRGARLFLCPEGLVRVRGDREENYPWGQVEAVWQKLDARRPIGIRFLFVGGCSPNVIRIQLRDGTQAEFGRYVDAQEELVAGVLQETCKRLLPQAIAAYEAGEVVTFGNLHVSREGLRYEGPQVSLGNYLAIYKSALAGLPPGEKTLRWNDFQEIHLEDVEMAQFPKDRVKEGSIVIRESRKRLRWFQTYVRNVPNLHVFMALLNHVRGLSPEPGSANGQCAERKE